jgi:hypothetical protein
LPESEYKESYKSLIQSLSLEDDNTDIEYTLYDMNQDDIPELIIRTGTCEADFKLSFYTYEDKIGLIPIGNNFSGFHIGFYVDKSTNKFCTIWSYMDEGGIVWYSFDGSYVSEFKRQDNIEYNLDNFENYDEIFAAYGDFEALSTTCCSILYNEDEWITYGNDDSTDSKTGIDYSMIDNY